MDKTDINLHSILDASPFPIAVVDMDDLRIFYWSASALTLFGHTAPTTREWYALAYPDPEYRARVLEQWKPALENARQTGTTVNTGEYRITCSDGSVRICELHAVFLANNLIVSFNDITLRKQAEDALKTEKDLFTLFLDNSPAYVFFKDSELRSLRLSRNYEEMLGMPVEQALGKTMDELFPSELARSMMADDRRILAEGRMVTVEEELNGRMYETLKFPVKGTDGTMMLAGFTMDITRRKQSEEALQQTQKLESLGIMAGGIAHDFNNLLSGIFGHIDLARQNCSDSAVADGLTEAVNTIERARGLTRQLLTFAKGGAPVKETGSLVPFVQETAQFSLSGSNVSCTFDIQEGLRQCCFDRSQIAQVINNLVINAQQAMPDGGTVMLTARNMKREHGEMPLLPAGEYVKISISDSGTGIPDKILTKIFDPFFTTKQQGHGLGLATCYSIITRHDGYIYPESKPGKGSTFHIYLPAAAEETHLPEKKPVTSHRGSGTFLVMDDEEMIRNTVGRMLEAFGYDTVLTVNGREAVAFADEAAEAGRKIAGMLFDLTVPGGMGGKEAIGEIRKLNTDTPAFVSSGYADDPVMAAPAAYGFTASISKPFVVADLAQVLNEYMPNYRSQNR